MALVAVFVVVAVVAIAHAYQLRTSHHSPLSRHYLQHNQLHLSSNFIYTYGTGRKLFTPKSSVTKLHLSSIESLEDDANDNEKVKKSKIKPEKMKRGKKPKASQAENSETKTYPLNIVRKEVPLFPKKFDNITSSSARRENIPLSESLMIQTPNVAPKVKNFRRIDPEEADFYNIEDDNDYLLPEEADDANSVLNARKLISDYYDELFEDESPIDITNVPPRFRHSFWALNLGRSSAKDLETRATLWTDHLQWSRRSQLISLIPKTDLDASDLSKYPAAKALVQEEFTVLSADYLSPVAQLIRIDADSVSDAQTYLQNDPLLRQKNYQWSQWHLSPATQVLSPGHDKESSLDADLMAPFLAYVYVDNTPPPTSSSTSTTSSSTTLADFEHLFHQCRRHQEAMVEARIALLHAPNRPGTDRQDKSRSDVMAAQFFDGDAHRIHHFSLTYQQQQQQQQSSKTTTSSSSSSDRSDDALVNGALFVFNAHSQRDALRFFENDPLISSFAIDAQSLGKLDRVVFAHPTVPQLRLLLAPVNAIDVNGLFFLQPSDFASQAALDTFHAMQPTDVLQADVHPSLIKADDHHDNDSNVNAEAAEGVEVDYREENAWVLQQLDHHQVNISYSWMSNLRDLGVMAVYDLPEPDARLYERWQRPMNMIQDVPKMPTYAAPNATVAKTRVTKASIKQGEEEQKALQRKKQWIPPLMGRKAFAAANRYFAIATRRLLDRMDGYVPIEDGSLSVIPEHLVGRSAGGKKSKNRAKNALWSQKPLKKDVPTTKEDKKKALTQSADFFFGPGDNAAAPVEGGGDNS